MRFSRVAFFFFAAAALVAAASSDYDDDRSMEEESDPLALIQQTMFTPGKDEPDTSFEDALLSAPQFSHPAWAWLQREHAALRGSIISNIDETRFLSGPKILHPSDKNAARRKARAQNRQRVRKAARRLGLKGRTNRALLGEYHRIRRLWRAARAHHREGQRMKQFHLARLGAAQKRVDNLRAQYARLQAAYKKAVADGIAAKDADAKRLDWLRKEVVKHQNAALVAHRAAAAAEAAANGLKAKLLGEQARLRGFLRKVLAEQRARQDAGLQALDGRQRRELRDYLRKEIRQERKQINNEIRRVDQGKPPVPPTPAPAPRPANNNNNNTPRPVQNNNNNNNNRAATAASRLVPPSGVQPTSRSSEVKRDPPVVVRRKPTGGAPKQNVVVRRKPTGGAPKQPNAPVLIKRRRRGFPIWNTKARPIHDCAHLPRKARTGRYWMRTGTRKGGRRGKVYLGFCLQRVLGGGWTLTTERKSGAKPSSPRSALSIDKSGSFNRHIFNLRGRRYREVLVRRISKSWCDSFGQDQARIWGSSRKTASAAMGVSVDGKWFNYANQFRKSIVRQRISTLTNWSRFQRRFKRLPWRSRRVHGPNVRIRRVNKSGSVVRVFSRRPRRYLEVDNLNSLTRGFGGCIVKGQAAFQVYTRPFNPSRFRLSGGRNPTALRRAGSNVDACCGVTKPGQFRPYGSAMYVDVDMARCGFTSTPQIFSTERGLSSHWTDVGNNEHYDVSPRSFRVYVTSQYAWRYRFQYQISWCALGQKTRAARRATNKRISTCCGSSRAGTWNVYHAGQHIWQDIDMRRCGFTKTPQIFTSLSGLSSHWVLRGVTATYLNSPTGFRSYIYGTTTGNARAYNYRLQWCAIGETRKGYRRGARIFDRFNRLRTTRGRLCCGRVVPSWKNYYGHGIYAGIDTSSCRFSDKVRYFGALSGTSHLWTTTGASAIYDTQRNSFTTYIFSHGWTIRRSHAKAFSFAYDWCGVDYGRSRLVRRKNRRSLGRRLRRVGRALRRRLNRFRLSRRRRNNKTARGIRQGSRRPSKFGRWARAYKARWRRALKNRIRRSRRSALRRAGSNVDSCCGTTHIRDWKPYGQHLFVDIHIKKCGFLSTPRVFSSMEGVSSHWTSTGNNAHYDVTRNKFRVYSTALYGWRYQFGYRLNWCAYGTQSPRARRRSLRRKNRVSTCCGTSRAGTWNVYSAGQHIWQDIDMRRCGFTSKPQVFTALNGLSSHWGLLGVSSTYFNSAKGFRSYIYGTNTAVANAYKYRLSWCATGRTRRAYRRGVRVLNRAGQIASKRGRICCGKAKPGWSNYWYKGVVAQVDTTRCNFSSNVRYFGALSGSSHHWATTGADAIYSPTAKSFTIYIFSHGWNVRTQHAAWFNWGYDWCGVDTQ